MRRTVLSVLLAIAPALALGVEDPRPVDPAAAPTQQKTDPGSEKSQEPAKPAPPAAAPGAANAAMAPEGLSDPLKMASPNAAERAKIPQGAPVDAKTYIIGPEDVLGILAYGQKDFTIPSYYVRPDGRITVPLAGEILASGRTPEQLAADITQKLTNYIKDPQVIVSVLGSHSKKFRIQGQVNRPGEFDLLRATTVMEALINAGGFRDFADEKHIKIWRDGGKKILDFNYKDASKGKHLDKNVLLEPNDIIIVK